jgi:tRNA (cytidine/uridine-2'-O-)-methyltransferase
MVHVFFHEPRIAGNTGNAIRLSAVTGARLHLIEPLGFDLEDAKLRRAGLDYPDLDQALGSLPASRVFAFTAHSSVNFADVQYRDDDILLFGCEPTGLPEDVLENERITRRVRIPMLPARRSLNLANSASIAVYEAWRQQGYPGGL